MQLEQAVYKDTTRTIDERVQDLLNQMTVEEKVGQMTQIEKNSVTPRDATKYHLGSILSGGGGNPTINNVHEWRKMVQAYIQASLETRLGIPIIYGVDAVHGHSNVKGAVIFPHNVGLGATRDADLVERIAQATASECLATNVHWNFAPAVSVPQDIRWGRTYEGYSENSDVVRDLGAAYVRGLQHKHTSDEWVLASVKHFVGDGGTMWDSRVSLPHMVNSNWQAANENWRIDQGDTRIDEETLRRVHLAPYRDAIDAGAENIMVSFSSWNGLKMHAHEYLITQVLKNEWGFEGFLVSDWMAHTHLSADDYEAYVTTVNAGLDMIMVPNDPRGCIEALLRGVKSGDISRERLDDAVARILRVKFKLGLFEKPFADDIHLEKFGGSEHRTIAREAVQKSLVLLKNDDVLPIGDAAQVAVAGIAADDIGLACGGWTINWQGGQGSITEGTTLLAGLKEELDATIAYSPDGDFKSHVDVAIVVVAELPYAEGEGDKEDLTLSAEDTALIEKVRKQCDKLILVVYSGRPILITHVEPLCDAIVAAWLPGTEAHAIADVLIGRVPFTGKLAYTWFKSMDQLPLSHFQASGSEPLWAFGHGLTT